MLRGGEGKCKSEMLRVKSEDVVAASREYIYSGMAIGI